MTCSGEARLFSASRTFQAQSAAEATDAAFDRVKVQKPCHITRNIALSSAAAFFRSEVELAWCSMPVRGDSNTLLCGPQNPVTIKCAVPPRPSFVPQASPARLYAAIGGAIGASAGVYYLLFGSGTGTVAPDGK